jgi:anaerobic selenocysteine-containing dehydrogenase
MFLEHDDIYKAGGHTHLMFGPKVLDAPGECRSNHWLYAELAKRLGASHPGFGLTEREIINATLKLSGRGTLADLEAGRWIDCAQPFETAHFLSGFRHAGGKFRFKPDWSAPSIAKIEALPPRHRNLAASMPKMPDHWEVIEAADTAHPFRLVAAPARTFLNSTFTETPQSLARERRPELLLHPDDAAIHGLAGSQLVEIGNERGSVKLHLRVSEGLRRGVAVAEGIWPNGKHEGGAGINTLTSAEPAAPFGGAVFHDTKIWIRPLAAEPSPLTPE